MRNGDVVTAAFEHHLHSGASIGMIVSDEKPMPARDSGFLFCYQGAFTICAVFCSNRRRARFQFNNKGGAFTFTATLDSHSSTLRIYHPLGNGVARTESA